MLAHQAAILIFCLTVQFFIATQRCNDRLQDAKTYPNYFKRHPGTGQPVTLPDGTLVREDWTSEACSKMIGDDQNLVLQHIVMFVMMNFLLQFLYSLFFIVPYEKGKSQKHNNKHYKKKFSQRKKRK